MARKSRWQGVLDELTEVVDALKNGEDISKRWTCRTVALDPLIHRYTPEQVKEVRQLLGASQASFARFLGVTRETVRAWEHGTNAPCDMACRFLEEIQHNPEYWKKRLRGSLVVKR